MSLRNLLLTISLCSLAISAQEEEYVNLTVTAGPHGTTIPSGTIQCRTDTRYSGDPQRIISAYPDSGYVFDRWEVVSGYIRPEVLSAHEPKTLLPRIEEDIVMKAHFIERGDVHEITSSGRQYSYVNEIIDNSRTPLMLFRFTAPASGNYRVVIDNHIIEGTIWYNNLTYYGKDPTLQNGGFNYMSEDSSNLSCPVTAHESGEEHFFSFNLFVRPGTDADFTIRYESMATLTVIHSGGYTGTVSTSPSAGVPHRVRKGVGIGINTIDYRDALSIFSHWEVVSGTITIPSPDSSETSIVVNSDHAVIRAVYSKSIADTLIFQTDGHGTVNNHDTVFMRPNRNTLNVLPRPDELYEFDSWSVIDGDVTITPAGNLYPSEEWTPEYDKGFVSVTLNGVKATIRANFRYTGTGAPPELTITSIDISGHRDINVNVQVLDSLGRGVTGLDASNFTLSEDGVEIPFKCTSIAEVGGLTACLAIDRHHDTRTSGFENVQHAAKIVIASMGVDDRCAIVAFDKTAHLMQEMTGDTTALNRTVDDLYPIWDRPHPQCGLELGVAQLVDELEPRILIIFSDFMYAPELKSNDYYYEFYSSDSAINNNVTTYSVNESWTNTQKIQSYGQGFYQMRSNSPENMQKLNEEIRINFGSRYILTYETPDSIFNGDTHTVVVSVTRDSKVDIDTGYWDESNAPPKVLLTTATEDLLHKRHSEDMPFTISAEVIDDGTIKEVTLYYRPTGSVVSYTDIVMTNSPGTVYSAVIPAEAVHSPGVDFYIVAKDEFGLRGNSPKILYPRNDPWTIFVGDGENLPPVITLTPPTLNLMKYDQKADGTLTLSAVVKDDIGVKNVTLFFRTRGSNSEYSEVPMSIKSGNIYEGTIPAKGVLAPGIEFYLQATDNENLSSTSPENPQTTPYLITVSKNIAARPRLIEHAAYFADNGTGSVDRVEMFYYDTADVSTLPDSILLHWPDLNQSRMVRKKDFIIDTSDTAHLTVTIPAPFPENITRCNVNYIDLGTLYGTSSDGTRIASPFAIADSVGPLIRSAQIAQRNSGENDTLTIDFSEPVDANLVTGQCLTLLKNNGGAYTEVPLTVSNAYTHPDGRSVVATVPFTEEDASPAEGDSLRITPNGPITDHFGNSAHQLNRPVIITSAHSLPQIIKAVYEDRNADGMIDTARFVFSKPVFIDSTTVMLQWNETSATATYTQFRLGGEGVWHDTMDVSITPPFFNIGHLRNKTSGSMSATVTFTGYASDNTTRQTVVEDGAAPVLTAMRYHFGGYRHSHQEADTLYAKFSEQPGLTPSAKEPFLFHNSERERYLVSVANPSIVSLDTTGNGGDEVYYRFIVSGVTAEPKVSKNDSSWINAAAATVADIEGNVQKNEHNRKVPLYLRQPALHLEFITGPNPFSRHRGAAVIIRAETHAGYEIPVRFKTRAAFYDKVGNLVKRFPEDMRNDPRFQSRLAAINGSLVKKGSDWHVASEDLVEIWWDGTNRNGRIVGEGTYMALPVISYTIEDEATETYPKERILIGVVR